MDMQFGADGAFYLLTYGDGFFNINPDAGMYKWEYAKGQRAPRAVLTTDRTDGPVPLTVRFSSEGTMDPDPGDSIVIEWDFGDGTTSNDPNPTHTYTQRGRFTAVLRVTDSSGQTAATSTVITVGNTSPTIQINLPVEGGTFAFGDSIPYNVSVTDPEDGVVDCDDVQVTFVLGHDTHGHAEESKTGCSGTLQTLADDVSHGGNVFGVINVRYTDRGGPGGVPDLTTIAETKIRQRKQQVEHVVTQLGTNVQPNTDEGSGEHRASLAPGDWMQLNGPFNLVNINSVTFRVADSENGRTAGSPLAAVECAPGRRPGRSCRRSTSRRPAAARSGTARRSRSHWPGRTSCSWSSAPSTAGRAATTCSCSTTWSSTARASRSSRTPRTGRSAATCRPRCRCRWARRRPSGPSSRASRGPTTRPPRPT